MGDASDYLSAAEIEAIDERARLWKTRGIEQTGSVADDRAALLRHLDALTAPADGEALGRELYERMGAAQVAFYAMRAIQKAVPPWEDLDAPARGLYITEALRLHAIGHAVGALSREGEIARLEAELARETHKKEDAQDQVTTLRGKINEEALAATMATARDEGAREERAAIVKQVRHWAANGRDGMPVVDGNTSLVDWIATEIAESADEIARGGR